MVDFCEQFHNFAGEAVRTSRNRKTYDSIGGNGLFILLGKLFDFQSMSGSIRLEISQIFHLGIFSGEKLLSGFKLLADASASEAI